MSLLLVDKAEELMVDANILIDREPNLTHGEKEGLKAAIRETCQLGERARSEIRKAAKKQGIRVSGRRPAMAG